MLSLLVASGICAARASRPAIPPRPDPDGMRPGGLRALEFDRIVAAVRSFALTPTGAARLDALTPAAEPAAVRELLAATTETVGYLADNPVFPLRAPEDLEDLLGLLQVDGRALEPARLLALADYLESIETSAAAIRRSGGEFPRLRRAGRTRAVVHGRDRRRPAQDRVAGRRARSRQSAAGVAARSAPQAAHAPARHARVVPARQGDVEVPAGPGRHRAQRPIRPAREGRASRLAARARARRVIERRDAVPGAARDGRDQQRPGRRSKPKRPKRSSGSCWS